MTDLEPPAAIYSFQSSGFLHRLILLATLPSNLKSTSLLLPEDVEYDTLQVSVSFGVLNTALSQNVSSVPFCIVITFGACNAISTAAVFPTSVVSPPSTLTFLK